MVGLCVVVVVTFAVVITALWVVVVVLGAAVVVDTLTTGATFGLLVVAATVGTTTTGLDVVVDEELDSTLVSSDCFLWKFNFTSGELFFSLWITSVDPISLSSVELCELSTFAELADFVVVLLFKRLCL